jgi:hypothetical protein
MPAGHRPGRLHGGLDGFELLVLSAFAAASLWVLGLDLWQVIAHGRTWTGTDGVYLVDQLQYLAWIRDASHHALASNLFVLHATPADYFQPAIALSGGLSAAGVVPWLALLFWKPVAVGASFFAVRRYTRLSLGPGWHARAALVLALFFGSFTVVYGSASTIGDLWPVFLSWGYVFSLLAVAALVAALVAHARARERSGRLWMPALLGAAASLLHPWQGELLILTVLGSELALGRRRFAAAAATIAGTALPLVYYVALGRADLSWRLARQASKHAFPLWSIALALAPLLLTALPVYRRRPRTFLGASARVWPLAALVVYAVSASALGATPLHAFGGVTIPLSVLAVEGATRLEVLPVARARLLAGLAIALFTLPAGVYELVNARRLVAPREGTARFIAHGERSALDFLLHDPRAGGVVARSYLGALVPGATGRHTFVGNCLWSEPHCPARLVAVRELFTGGMAAAAARAFVASARAAGARFLLADCRPAADLGILLGPIVRSVERFGCARVYVLKA